MTERDRLGDERLLDLVSLGLRALACGIHLGTQVGAHLARQAGDRTESEHGWGIALVRAGRALAVAAHERVLRLGARAVGSALRVTAEAPEGVGTAGRALLDATQPGRVVGSLAVGAAAAPPVLGTEEISEQLVSDDEERVGVQDVPVEGRIREGGMLDELARVAGIERAVEFLALAELDGSLQILGEDDVVGDGHVGGRERRGRRRRARIAVRGRGAPREPDAGERHRDERGRADTQPSPALARPGLGGSRHRGFH